MFKKLEKDNLKNLKRVASLSSQCFPFQPLAKRAWHYSYIHSQPGILRPKKLSFLKLCDQIWFIFYWLLQTLP